MKASRLRSASEIIPNTHLIINSDASVYHLGVTGDQVADDIWIVGDPERVPKISKYFDCIQVQLHRREYVLHTGLLKGKPLTVVSSGIGVDNIDILINELDGAVNVDPNTRQIRTTLRRLRFLRLGTSGTILPEIPIHTIVAARYSFAHDGVPLSYEAEMEAKEKELLTALKERVLTFDTTYVAQSSEELLQRYPIFDLQGITYTANGFYGPQGRSVRLHSKNEDWTHMQRFEWEGMRITNIEMESSGMYALASMLGHQALTCCVLLANRATQEFTDTPEQAVEDLIQKAITAF
jgi:uridine phosphorylase